MVTALVTGGTRGIGWAIAESLVQDGMDVIVQGAKNNGKGPTGTRFFSCDFSKTIDVERFAMKMARETLGVLVNSAGINKIGEIERYDVKDLQRIHQVNVVAPFILIKSVISGMKKRNYGRILNISSIFGEVSRAGRSAYSTSKFGLFGMTRAVALESAKHNVLVNCLAPGFIDTDMTRNILGKAGISQLGRQIPMGRMGKPSEIAKVAAFLVSEQNSYMTGQLIVADGGYTSA